MKITGSNGIGGCPGKMLKKQGVGAEQQGGGVTPGLLQTS
jgi:hypothetical protein